MTGQQGGLQDRLFYSFNLEFSKNRHDRLRDSGALRHVFETVLRRCMTEGLVQGEGFAADASIIKADANRSRGVAGTGTIDWSKGDGPSRAVREYPAALVEVNQAKDDCTRCGACDRAQEHLAD